MLGERSTLVDQSVSRKGEGSEPMRGILYKKYYVEQGGMGDVLYKKHIVERRECEGTFRFSHCIGFHIDCSQKQYPVQWSSRHTIRLLTSVYPMIIMYAMP